MHHRWVMVIFFLITTCKFLGKCAKTESHMRWQFHLISHASRFLISMVISIITFVLSIRILDTYLEKRVALFEMRCLRRLLGIGYKQRIMNMNVIAMVTNDIGPHHELLKWGDNISERTATRATENCEHLRGLEWEALLHLSVPNSEKGNYLREQ